MMPSDVLLASGSKSHAGLPAVCCLFFFADKALLVCIFYFLFSPPPTSSGTYLTNEAKGADDAPDADTAIINAEGNHAHTEEKKEYFI